MTILGLLAPSFKCHEIFYLLFFNHLNCEYLLKNYNKFAKDWVGEKVLNYENNYYGREKSRGTRTLQQSTVILSENSVFFVALELYSNQL